jgi:hypothetical protein
VDPIDRWINFWNKVDWEKLEEEMERLRIAAELTCCPTCGKPGYKENRESVT